MPHRAEHFPSADTADKKPRGHRFETTNPRAKGMRLNVEANNETLERERAAEAGEQEEVLETLHRKLGSSKEAERLDSNTRGKKAYEDAARLKAQANSQDFFETFGVYPSQMGSEEEAKKLWSKDTGFFRRIAAKLSGTENPAASQAWKAWYEADQRVEELKMHPETDRKAARNRDVRAVEEITEFPGAGLAEEASELVSPQLARDVVSGFHEGKKAIAQTKKIEAEMEAESHRTKAARAAQSMLNRIGLVAQDQNGYEDFNVPTEKLQAMNILDLESALHGFDAAHGKDGLKTLEASSEPRSYDSKETQQRSKDTVKNIKGLRGSYDKQMDKFQEEYKAYLETPAGMQEATTLALGRLEGLRDQSLALSSSEETKAFGDRLFDMQRQMTGMEEALSVVREKIKKESGEKGAGSKAYRESPQAQLFITLQEGVKDLYEDQQKRVRDGSKQNMKSRVGMYGNTASVPQVGAMGGFGDIERGRLGRRSSSKQPKEVPADEMIEDLTTHAVLEEEAPVLEDKSFKALETLDKKPANKKKQKAPEINLEQDEAWTALSKPRAKEPVAAPEIKAAPLQQAPEQPKPLSRAERALGQKKAEFIKDHVEAAASQFEALAAGNEDDKGLQAEMKELKRILGKNAKMSEVPEKYAYLLYLADKKKDKEAQKLVDRMNAILRLDADDMEKEMRRAA